MCHSVFFVCQRAWTTSSTIPSLPSPLFQHACLLARAYYYNLISSVSFVWHPPPLFFLSHGSFLLLHMPFCHTDYFFLCLYIVLYTMVAFFSLILSDLLVCAKIISYFTLFAHLERKEEKEEKRECNSCAQRRKWLPAFFPSVCVCVAYPSSLPLCPCL